MKTADEIQTKRVIELEPGDRAIVLKMNKAEYGPVQGELYLWDGTHGEMQGFTLTASGEHECWGSPTIDGKSRDYGSARKGIDAAMRYFGGLLGNTWVQFVRQHAEMAK